MTTNSTDIKFCITSCQPTPLLLPQLMNATTFGPSLSSAVTWCDGWLKAGSSAPVVPEQPGGTLGDGGITFSVCSLLSAWWPLTPSSLSFTSHTSDWLGPEPRWVCFFLMRETEEGVWFLTKYWSVIVAKYVIMMMKNNYSLRLNTFPSYIPVKFHSELIIVFIQT